MSLHIEYRPKTLEEFIGNKTTVQSLEVILDREEGIPHVFLFSGPTGCGKTTLGRIVADRLGCNEIDFQEINTSDQRGIDTARQIISTMRYKSIGGNVRVYLLDECHSGTVPYWQSLLKALEDTPDHVYFILCTTEPDKLPKTILNRCSVFKVEKLSESELLDLLNWVMNDFEERVKQDTLKKIAEAAEGSPRKALVILDQIIDLDPNDMEDAIIRMSVDEKQIIDLCRAVIDRKKWPAIATILKGIKDDPEKVRWAMLGYFNSVLLKGTERAAWVIDCFKEPFYYSGKAGLTLACYQALDDGK